MNYGEIKRKVLEYLNQYSIGGAIVPDEYNNQDDYIHRIPALINSAILEIRGKWPRKHVAQLSGGYVQGRYVLHSLPSDYKGLCTGGVFVGVERQRTNDYRLFGDNSILVPDDGEPHFVEYYQTPEQIHLTASQENDPPDSYDFNETPEAIDAACVYAASWIALNEDAFDHTALNNLFESKLERMAPRPTAEVRQIGTDYDNIMIGWW